MGRILFWAKAPNTNNKSDKIIFNNWLQKTDSHYKTIKYLTRSSQKNIDKSWNSENIVSLEEGKTLLISYAQIIETQVESKVIDLSLNKYKHCYLQTHKLFFSFLFFNKLINLKQSKAGHFLKIQWQLFKSRHFVWQ